MNPNRCESCGAEIIWARTQRGERMPVDVEPSAAGNVILTGQPPKRRAGVLTRGQAEGARAAGQSLYLSHFASCPMASAHRKRQRAADARHQPRRPAR